MVLLFLILGLVGCTSTPNSNPDVPINSSKDTLPEFPENQVNMAFLSNVAGNYTANSKNPTSPVFTMTSNGFFFYTNKLSGNSFTLKTNYSFYSAQSETQAIFRNLCVPNSQKYVGVRYFLSNVEGKKTTNLGIERTTHDIPDNANSTRSYAVYTRK